MTKFPYFFQIFLLFFFQTTEHKDAQVEAGNGHSK